MSQCTIEEGDIIRVARSHLMERLALLKSLTCCGKEEAPPPVQGVDLHVVGFDKKTEEIRDPETGRLVATDTTLTIKRNDAISFSQTISESKVTTDTFVERMEVTPVNQGGQVVAYSVQLFRNDQTVLSGDVPVAPIPDFDAAYRLVDKAQDYTLEAEDFDGRTIVRGTLDGDQVITVGRPPEAFKGKSVIVRKAAGDIDTTLLLQADNVTFSPPDAVMLRRVGSTVTLMYTGDGNWDIYGELP